jgi:hypothetical protein
VDFLLSDRQQCSREKKNIHKIKITLQQDAILTLKHYTLMQVERNAEEMCNKLEIKIV